MRFAVAVAALLVLAPAVADGCSGTHDCSNDAECGTSEQCLYPIGSCPSQGQCFKVPYTGSTACETRGLCGTVQEICGCDGGLVTTGCGYPSGFASGPAPSMSYTCETSGGGEAGEGDGGSADADARGG